MLLPREQIRKSFEIVHTAPQHLTSSKKKVKLEKVLQIPELNIKVCCNEVVKVWEGQVVEGSDIEEIVGILKLRSGWGRRSS